MNNKKYIRFVDGDSNTLFHVPDGGSIKVHSAWDHQDRVLPCKYIDPYHVEISGNCYHISQFAELMERNGNRYEPVSEIGDLDFYEKKFFDRENIGADGKRVPYYTLIKQVSDRGTSLEVETSYAFCLNPATPEKAFCKFTWHRYSGQADISFSSDIGFLCEDAMTYKRINNIVASIKETQRKKPSLLDVIRGCAAQVSEVPSEAPVHSEQQR